MQYNHPSFGLFGIVLLWSGWAYSQPTPVDVVESADVYRLDVGEIPLHVRLESFFALLDAAFSDYGLGQSLFSVLGVDPDAKESAELRGAAEAARLAIYGPEGPQMEPPDDGAELPGSFKAGPSISSAPSGLLRPEDLAGKSDKEIREMHAAAAEAKVRQLAEIWGGLSPSLRTMIVDFMDRHQRGAGVSTTSWDDPDDPTMKRETLFQATVQQVTQGAQR